MTVIEHRKSMHTGWVLFLLTLITALFTVFTPSQLINTDSVFGFNAMNGPFWTGKFNTLLLYNPATHKLDEHFLSWWSPGQYLIPELFVKLLSVKLGIAITLVNSFSVWLGCYGYFLVFKRYHFSPTVIFGSLILILFSGTVLPRYYFYQGGESLNFLIFPWLIVFQNLYLHKIGRFLFPGLFIFLSFICKLQLLIVAPVLIFLLVALNSKTVTVSELFKANALGNKSIIFRFINQLIPAALSCAVALAIIYFGFIAKGETASMPIRQVGFQPLYLMVPFASPLTSVYLAGFLFDNLGKNAALQTAFIFGLSVIMAFIIFIVYRKFREKDRDKINYHIIVVSLFLISLLAFFILYVKGSNIDFGPRHYKLVSFLFYPIILEKIFSRSRTIGIAGIAVLLVFAIGNHYRLARHWLSDTSVTKSFYRLSSTDMPLRIKDSLDLLLKVKTIVVSPYEARYAIDNKNIQAIALPNVKSFDASVFHFPIIYIDTLR